MLVNIFKRLVIIMVSAGVLVFWQFFGQKYYEDYLIAHGQTYNPATAWLMYLILMVVIYLFMWLGFRMIAKAGKK